MAITTITNGFDADGQFIPANQDTWADLGSSPYATWQNWTAWNNNPASMTVTIFEDTQAVASRLPLLLFQYIGAITVTLKIADQVDSSLTLISPTTINMVEDTEYSPVAGRYYEYTITLSVDSTGALPIMTTPVLSMFDGKTTEFQEGVDTSALGGTIDGRELATNIATATALVATAREGGTTYSPITYQDRQYAVPDDFVFTEAAIIVNVVSLSPPTIRCFDLNNESIDAIVDVYIQGLGSIVLTTDGVVQT